jgi:hypothetical protein
MPPEKELYFFSDDANWAKGLGWYGRYFEAAPDGAVPAEATPQTMVHAEALRRLRELVPRARLVAIVRNPTERAYSNWRHVYFRNVTEHRPFARLVDDELREGAGLPRRDRCDPADLRHLTLGLYADQLEQVLEHFPREQLHVVVLEDVKGDPDGVFAGVCDFLGLDAPPPGTDAARPSNPHKEFRPVWLWRALVRHRLLEPFPPAVGKWVADRMSTTRHRPEPMDPAVRARLDDFYREPNRRLAAFLDRDLEGWAL